MAEFDEKKGKKQEKEVNWNDFNYPPLLKLMHFRPSEIPQSKKSVVMMSFIIHILILINTLLSIVDNCVLGGLSTLYPYNIDILYSILFFLIFNPIVLFLFYRCHIGMCKQRSKLSLFIYIQPLVIIIQIVIAIVDFIGFNGFVKVAALYREGEHTFAATLALVCSIIYLVVAILSGILCPYLGYLYFLVWKKRSIIAKALI